MSTKAFVIVTIKDLTSSIYKLQVLTSSAFSTILQSISGNLNNFNFIKYTIENLNFNGIWSELDWYKIYYNN